MSLEPNRRHILATRVTTTNWSNVDELYDARSKR